MSQAAWRIGSWLGRSYADSQPMGGPNGVYGLTDASSTWLASLALGVILYTLDSFTLTDGAASALYGGVLVILAERRQRRLILTAAVACVVLTALSYFSRYRLAINGDSIFRRAVSLAAIAAAALLTLRTIVEQEKIVEQLQLLELTNSALIVRGDEGLITYWSPGAERLYGWTAAEAVGRDARQLLRTELPGGPEIQTTLAMHGRWQGEVKQTTRDGRHLLVSVSWAVQRNERGRTVGVLETGIDVTRRRQSDRDLARSEARYRAIFNAAGIAIFEEDFSRVMPLLDELRTAGVKDFRRYLRDNPDFVLGCVEKIRIVDVNDGAIRMFRAPGKQDLLRSLSQIYLPGEAGSLEEILVAMAERKPSCSAQPSGRTLDGRPLTVHMSITFPRQYEDRTSVLVSIMDVTARRQAEENLARAQDSLTRVGQVSSLGEVVASIAHEMNQPLAAIVTNAEAALRWLRRGEPDRAEAAEALERIAHEGERAVQVLERIRSFLSNAPPQWAQFDLRAAVEEAALLIRRKLQRQEVTLQIDIQAGLPPIFGDRIQIEQVITNLLINAVQALAEGPVRPRFVIVRAEQEDGGTVLIEVQDNGSGIPVLDADYLFRPFFTTKVQGVGLGLSISRSIIEAHGGRIWLSGSEEVGTVAHFTLPIALGNRQDDLLDHTKV